MSKMYRTRSRKKKGQIRWPWIVLGTIAAVVVTVIVLLCLVRETGLFLNNKDKVLWALANTITEGEELEGFLEKAAAFTEKDAYTFGLKTQKKGDVSYVEYGHSKKGTQLYVSMKENGTLEQEMIAFVDDTQMKMKHSKVKDRVILYNYTKENKGALFQMLMNEEQVESLNESLDALYEDRFLFANGIGKKALEVMAEAYRELEFEETQAREFTIAGKEVKCKGYQTVLTKDILGILPMEKGTKVTFYIDGKRIAAITMEDLYAAEGEPQVVEIQLQGKDYRLQHIVLTCDEAVALELELHAIDKSSSKAILNGQYRVDWKKLDKIHASGIVDMLLWSTEDDISKNQWMYFTVEMQEGVSPYKFDGKTIDIGNASMIDIGKTLLDLLADYLEI